MKVKLFFLAVILIITNIYANPNAQGEMWVRVSDYNDNLRGGVKITVYDGNWQVVDIAYTSNITVEQAGNAFMYMSGEPISNSQTNAPYVIGPLNYSSIYFFVIDNKYAKISIGANNQTPDEHLYFQGSTFSLNPEHNAITLVSQANWNAKTVTVKNSFNGGKLFIDGVQENSGITKSFGSPTFPHTLKGKTGQWDDGYLQVFDEWQKFSSHLNANIETSINAIDATYTANFLNQYNVTFRNEFSGGTIKVNDVTYNSPTSTFHVLEDRNIETQAQWQIVNGIEYTFDHWDNGSTNNPETFTISNGHKNIVAHYNGKPENSYRNLHFNNTDPVGTPIKVMWNQHPNSNVTKYKIYRKTKYGSPQLIKTVNRTSASSYTYTDGLYSITHNTSSNNLLNYDVRAYYATEGTVSDDDWRSVYGEIMFKQNEEDLEERVNVDVLEYAISNYPNPFNPTTTIHYQLPEEANVSIKVFDILGKQIVELVNGEKGIGKHNVMFNSSNLSAGLYFYIIDAKPTNLNGKVFNQTNKMLLVK